MQARQKQLLKFIHLIFLTHQGTPVLKDQEIPSVRQEESNMGNMVLQTPPNSSFSSLDAPCQPKEKTDFKKFWKTTPLFSSSLVCMLSLVAL